MRWVALLRAVNLGGRNKVPMAELRALLEEAGYGDVRTYIASGNVLLAAPPGAAKLAATLERLVAAPRSTSASRMPPVFSIARVERLLGVSATLRNWRTVAALAELAAEA
jgi:uncharacterized protein (DUF1697 family)